MLALVAMAQAYVLAPGSRYAAANRRISVSGEPSVPLVAMQMPDERDYLYRDPPAQAEWQPEYTEQQYYRDAQPPAEWQPEYTEQQYYAPPPAEAQPEFVEEQYYRNAPPPAEWQPEYTEQQYYRGPPPPAEVQFAEQPYYQDAPPPSGVESRDAPAPAEVKLDFTEQQLEALERAQVQGSPLVLQALSRCRLPSTSTWPPCASMPSDPLCMAPDQDPFRAIRKVVYGLFGVVSD